MDTAISGFSTSTIQMATLLCFRCLQLQHGPPPNVCSSYVQVYFDQQVSTRKNKKDETLRSTSVKLVCNLKFELQIVVGLMSWSTVGFFALKLHN